MQGIADVVIALGCGLSQEGPSAQSMRNAGHAYTIYERGGVGHLLLQGGNPHDGVSEARAMCDFLRLKPSEHVVLEESSSNTYENALFAREIVLEKRGGSGITCNADGPLAHR